MPDIVGVRFKLAGKVYYFDPAGIELKAFDYVVVNTARGTELGQVTIAPKQVLASDLTAELKAIVRKATEEDVKRSQDYAAKEENALGECNKLIAKLKLPMKLVSAEYNLDGARLTFYFTAEERVDFRELVRELTAFFKTRIELRQIGPRDQAKLVGGLGRCGRALCCGSFLTEFTPVSIKMAKEQDLPLDPMKISGVCGRLQCCLSYENTQYREAKALMPKRGLRVETAAGIGVVIGGNPLKETVLVQLESLAEAEFPLALIKILEDQTPRPLGAPAAPSAKPGENLTANTQVPQNPPATQPGESKGPAVVEPIAEPVIENNVVTPEKVKPAVIEQPQVSLEVQKEPTYPAAIEKQTVELQLTPEQAPPEPSAPEKEEPKP
jgi:cell fate regulator YaaT (PSP1 superfamily)